MEQEKLCEGVDALDQSLIFVAVIIAGVLLSFRALLVQRDGLCVQLAGGEPDLSCLYPIRHTASSLIAGALAFFLCLSARSAAGADPNDPVALRSGRANLLASVLVFLAAAIRFDDVEQLHANGRL